MNVDGILRKMNKYRKDATAKGTYGEQAVIEVVRDYMKIAKGVLYHSYTYPYAKKRDGSNYEGNIKLEGSSFVEISGTDWTKDEIDLLYITDRRVFVIEVKARAQRWNIYDHWAKQQSSKVDKSPVAQAEKHARHLYHTIKDFLPEGNPNYIIPIVLFVDKSSIKDTRSDEFKQYIPVGILNNTQKLIHQNNKPLSYLLNIKEIVGCLEKEGKYEGKWK